MPFRYFVLLSRNFDLQSRIYEILSRNFILQSRNFKFRSCIYKMPSRYFLLLSRNFNFQSRLFEMFSCKNGTELFLYLILLRFRSLDFNAVCCLNDAEDRALDKREYLVIIRENVC